MALITCWREANWLDQSNIDGGMAYSQEDETIINT